MNLPTKVPMCVAAQESAISDSGPYGLEYLDRPGAPAHSSGGLVIALGGKGANEFADLQRWLPGMEVQLPNRDEPGAGGQEFDLDGADRLYILAGLGGRHGGVAALNLAKTARDRGIPAHALVSLPFDFEAVERHVGADAVRTELEHIATTCLAMRNQDLVEFFGGETPLASAFSMQTRWLAHAMSTLDGLAAAKRFRPLLDANGRGTRLHMGYARATGQDRINLATAAALECPLLNGRMGGQARLVLCSGVMPSEEEARRAETLTVAAMARDCKLVTTILSDPRMQEDVYITLLFGE